jgi:hypothetical protein
MDGRHDVRSKGWRAREKISQRAQAHSEEVANAPYRYVAIGVVEDGTRIAHVLYRFDIDAAHLASGEAEAWLEKLPQEEQTLARELSGRSHPQVVTCRRQRDATWRLLANHDFLGVGSTVVGIEENEEQQGGDGDV